MDELLTARLAGQPKQAQEAYGWAIKESAQNNDIQSASEEITPTPPGSWWENKGMPRPDLAPSRAEEEALDVAAPRTTMPVGKVLRLLNMTSGVASFRVQRSPICWQVLQNERILSLLRKHFMSHITSCSFDNTLTVRGNTQEGWIQYHVSWSFQCSRCRCSSQKSKVYILCFPRFRQLAGWFSGIIRPSGSCPGV
jgi:hypothetical protein